MRVSVRLFASFREIAGERQLDLEVPTGATVADVVTSLGERFPRLAGPLRSARFALDQAYVEADTPMQEGQELVLLPPVSGGSR